MIIHVFFQRTQCMWIFPFLPHQYRTQYNTLQLSHCSQSPKSVQFRRFSILHQFYAMRSRQPHEHSLIITTFRSVICRSTCFHSGSQCSSWPAPRVSYYHELSSGTSGSDVSGTMPCALTFVNLSFLHPCRVLFIGVVNIRHLESIYSSAPNTESINWGVHYNILNLDTWLPSSI